MIQIIPVASGKGGVGKSLLSANLAIALGQAGKKVLLADLDLGASNLHLVLGQPAPKNGLGTWLLGKGNFASIIQPTEYENLSFIAGDSEIPGLTALKAPQRNKLISHFKNVDADYLIVDLGAGTHQIILDLFLLSPQGIVVSAPTVTATLNAYLFLKNAVFRLMNSTFKRDTAAANWLKELKKDSSQLQKLYIPQMVAEIAKVDQKNAENFDRNLRMFRPRLVMNMIDDPKDADRALRIRRSCKEYLGLDLEHLGVMYRDSLEDKALASRLPVIIYKPQSVLSQAIYRIAEKVLASEPLRFGDDVEPPSDTNAASFDAAIEEAADDYEAKIAGIQDLLGSGALSTGELVETIKTLSYELTQVRKENTLLKSKIVKAAEMGFKV